ncbi:hypothetical protein AGMMS49983_08180 [Clostridia bacterium]|nr:hypothetical protein AGMMS49983_08180 [Clostridia bacterium]
MKQFIVLAAVLPILLLFLSQFMLDGQRQVRMSAAEDAVRTFCLEGAYYGRIGADETDLLRSRLAHIFGTSPTDITAELSPAREGVLSYRVTFPVGKIMAGAAFMGLSQAQNNGRAEITGEIVLPPQEPKPSLPNPPPDTEPERTENEVF